MRKQASLAGLLACVAVLAALHLFSCRREVAHGDIRTVRQPSQQTPSLATPARSSPAETTRAESQPPDAALRVGGEVKAPVLVHKVEPRYHPGTRRIAGVIVLEGVVTKKGTVRDLKIIKGENDPMAQNVMAAVKPQTSEESLADERRVIVIDRCCHRGASIPAVASGVGSPW
jgi:hypothetical protein